MSFVFHYYNKRYSETGGIFATLEQALAFIKKEGRFWSLALEKTANKYKNVNLLQATEIYSDHGVLLQYLPFNGDVGNLQEYPALYILRYPAVIYVEREDACKDGVNYVFKKNGYKYYWVINNDFGKKTMTVCNENWFKQVSGEIVDWEKIWEARVEEDEWSNENHIENFYI